jgi:hypothetical protein
VKRPYALKMLSLPFPVMNHELVALVGRYSVSHVCLSHLSLSLVNIGREQQESSIDESGS